MADAHMTLAFGAMGKARPDRAEPEARPLPHGDFRRFFRPGGARRDRDRRGAGQAPGDPAGHRHRRGRDRVLQDAR